MQKRHTDTKLYFHEQSITTRDYIIPYIRAFTFVGEGTKVLEIGCGEGGNLLPFLEMGCQVTGVDIAPARVEKAKDFLSDHARGHLQLVARDIYECTGILESSYDIIIMRDVIEHIHDQDRFMQFIKPYLGDKGIFFLAFPPWYNPFGGHQQICSNKFLSILPFYHLLPPTFYKLMLIAGGENEQKISDLLEIKETGISIERFRKICIRNHYFFKDETFYLVNPNYKVKFGLKPRKQNRFISALPHVRNYFTTCCYYLLSSNPAIRTLPPGSSYPDRKKSEI